MNKSAVHYCPKSLFYLHRTSTRVVLDEFGSTEAVKQCILGVVDRENSVVTWLQEFVT